MPSTVEARFPHCPEWIHQGFIIDKITFPLIDEEGAVTGGILFQETGDGISVMEVVRCDYEPEDPPAQVLEAVTGGVGDNLDDEDGEENEVNFSLEIVQELARLIPGESYLIANMFLDVDDPTPHKKYPNVYRVISGVGLVVPLPEAGNG